MAEHEGIGQFKGHEWVRQNHSYKVLFYCERCGILAMEDYDRTTGKLRMIAHGSPMNDYKEGDRTFKIYETCDDQLCAWVMES